MCFTISYYCLLDCLQGLGSARFARAWGVGKGEGGAKGPRPDRLGFRPVRPGVGGGEGGRGSNAGPAWFWLGGVHFSKSTIFNCFQFKKSEDNLIYDYIFTVFLNFTPKSVLLHLGTS